jgi:hypothetical protein
VQHHQLVIGRGAQRVAVSGHGVCMASDARALEAWRELVESVAGSASTQVLDELISAARRLGSASGDVAAAAAVEVEDGLLVVMVGAVAAARSGTDQSDLVRPLGDQPGVLVAPLGSRTAAGVDLDTRTAAQSLSTGTAPDKGFLLVPTEAPRDDDDRTHRREPRPAPVGPTVLGALCPSGHLNAPSWRLCRSCGEALGGSPLVEGIRPPLGSMAVSDGQVVELARSVVVGRRPTPASHDGRRECGIVAVTSPQKVVSRTHFEISVVDWDLRLIDRGSHNGTRLHRAHSRDVVLHEGQSAPLEVGDVIAFGDMTATIGAPTAGTGSS